MTKVVTATGSEDVDLEVHRRGSNSFDAENRLALEPPRRLSVLALERLEVVELRELRPERVVGLELVDRLPARRGHDVLESPLDLELLARRTARSGSTPAAVVAMSLLLGHR